MKKAILILLLVASSAVWAIPEVEREALIALYNSTNGANWTNNDNWLGPPGTEDRWFGVTIKHGRVAYLNLDNNNLVGQIPPEAGNLKKLDQLYLHNNQLSGAIPLELGNLEQCGEFALSNNKLSGPIPPELGKGDHRYYLWFALDNNELSGPIPPELGNIRIMLRLHLQNNKLSGPIPPELASIRMLHFIDLRNNELSGSIPPELGELDDLGGLALSNNMLSGPIPVELKNLELKEENADFRFNALYTDDASLRDFLNSTQIGGDWEGTQTIAPTNVSAGSPTGDSVKVTWTPIRFKESSGGYRVSFSTSSGGPYTLFSTTDNKNEPSLTVAGLRPGTTYYFVVQTVTLPHDLNNNTVVSEYSEEIEVVH